MRPDKEVAATRSKWRKFIHGGGGDLAERIGKSGLEVEDSGMCFTQFRVDEEELATGLLEGNFEKALQPFQAALDRIHAAAPELDSIMQEMKIG